MGWTYTYKRKGEPILDFFISHGVLSWPDDCPATYRVLDSALVRMKTFYAAVERIDKTTGEREVWAAVILCNYAPKDRYNFGWKDMDETMGPCETECPERILKLLTPTESKYAQEWREACWKRIHDKKARPKLEPGVEFDFGGNRYAVVEPMGRRGYRVRDVKSFLTYRMPLAWMRRISNITVPA
jgi:hypothetical protein